MKEFRKIAGINLGLLVIWMSFFTIMLKIDKGSDRFVILVCSILCLQALINFLSSLHFFIEKDKNRGIAFLLSRILVLLIGFSFCFGIGLMFLEI